MRFPLPRHLPFVVAAALGACGLATLLFLPTSLVVVIAVNLFFATYLALTLPALGRMDAEWLEANAKDTDAPVWLIFAISFAAAAASLAALLVAINGRDTPHPVALGFTLAAVPLGWLMVHTLTAVHYAHEYWQPDDGGTPRAGLAFPKTERSGGPDFAYFSFTIGMTFQTSDVEVGTAAMRRTALLHAIASFFYNTVLVASAVNLAVSLGSN